MVLTVVCSSVVRECQAMHAEPCPPDRCVLSVPDSPRPSRC